MKMIENILEYLGDQVILTEKVHKIVVSPILKQHQNGKLNAFILMKNHIEFLIREEEKKEEEFELKHTWSGEWFDQILLGLIKINLKEQITYLDKTAKELEGWEISKDFTKKSNFLKNKLKDEKNE